MPEVQANHLNIVDMMNGKGSLNYKGLPPITKGAGSILIDGTAYTEIDENFDDLIHQSRLFIYQKKEEIVSNLCEFWDYKGFEIDKYYLEEKLTENGSLAIYKVGGELFLSGYTVEEFDIYKKPTKIRIVEVNNQFLNDLMPSKFAILRAHISQQSIWTMILRMINQMEKVLYALEDNINASKPKGILINNGMRITSPTNKDREEGMESIVNSPNTFFEVNVGDGENSDNFNTDLKAFWIPLELADRSEVLIIQYNFYNAKLKEMFGLGMNTINKKERVIQDEMSEQQKVSNANIMHMFNIRKTDLETANKLLGTKLQITKNPELWEVGEPTPENEKEGNKDEKNKKTDSTSKQN